MKNRRIPLSHSSAFTLVEVMVTLAVTTIGLVGLSAMMIEAGRTVQDSGNRSQAIWIVEDLTNRIIANREEVQLYDTGGVPVDCNAVPQTSCADFFNGVAKVTADACTSNQLAAYDLWDVACSRDIVISNSDLVRSDSSSTISAPQLIVSVQAGAIEGQDLVTIDLSWDSRIGGTDVGGNRIYISDTKLTDRTIMSRRENIRSDFTP
ncbi:MAG: hypothetical protein CMI09_13765 [Oceanospirillaceae bacterium]|nr:hypothetical protein [Oceanospirillaceae bacterium]